MCMFRIYLWPPSGRCLQSIHRKLFHNQCKCKIVRFKTCCLNIYIYIYIYILKYKIRIKFFAKVKWRTTIQYSYYLYNKIYSYILVGKQLGAQFFLYDKFIWILYMFQATMCSSSEWQLSEYNFCYNHSVLVAARYASRDGTKFHLDLHTGRPLTQSDYNRSCIQTIVILRMST